MQGKKNRKFFICSLFNEEVSNSNFLVSNGWMMMNDVLEGMWKDAAVDYFKIYPHICIEGLRRKKRRQK
jgi:hypothetical protein